MKSRANERRLLILSCSRKKKTTSQSLPALERYDGPSFRVVRKFIDECPAEARALDIRILSAKFGLITADQPIAWYDARMTMPRAVELNPAVLNVVKRALARRKYRKIFINAGKDYLLALKGYELLMTNDLEVTVAEGTPGRRQAALRDWLRNGPPPQLPNVLRGKAKLREAQIALTPEEVIAIACRALADCKGAPDAYQTWYVPINGRRVAPKWLVSQITGLPVRSFVTDEARRLLAQLGIEVMRV
jgi:hypothetical protein